MPRRRCYPADTWEDEWALTEPMLPTPACETKAGSRPEKHPRREIVDAIRYVVETGCKWRALSKDFPSWRTCYGFMARWAACGVVGQIRDQLRKRIRREMGRAPGAVATVIDFQSIKAAETVGQGLPRLRRREEDQRPQAAPGRGYQGPAAVRRDHSGRLEFGRQAQQGHCAIFGGRGQELFEEVGAFLNGAGGYEGGQGGLDVALAVGLVEGGEQAHEVGDRAVLQGSVDHFGRGGRAVFAQPADLRRQHRHRHGTGCVQGAGDVRDRSVAFRRRLVGVLLRANGQEPRLLRHRLCGRGRRLACRRRASWSKTASKSRNSFGEATPLRSSSRSSPVKAVWGSPGGDSATAVSAAAAIK
ncbi:hypothetical protein CRI70_17260 [Streptomyces sp. Ru87]|nr:hypothetical protein CRI70_17260 [Streptomyces sp. Ru87]